MSAKPVWERENILNGANGLIDDIYIYSESH